ncbi:hypothetical protein CYMTET_54366 [Cymbomonas tetramitiformis]|uniref:Uncharacterized protein n=1 Tax=Cymbomonas tetramitiformis TaxID=36881 RepID=A0AAE0BGI1_9CHLO|nr:hypothetical protein CYMTET_54366 [Cymbomonas tetramitiformis]
MKSNADNTNKPRHLQRPRTVRRHLRICRQDSPAVVGLLCTGLARHLQRSRTVRRSSRRVDGPGARRHKKYSNWNIRVPCATISAFSS